MNFSSDISVFWLLPWLLISLGLAVWFYKGKSSWVNEISVKWKRVLIGLRTLTFFILGVLFIGLIFQAFNYRVEKPVLVIGVDTSSSLLNYKDSTRVKKTIEELITLTKSQLSEKFDVETYQFASDLKSLDSVDFHQSQTDLSKSFEQLHADFYNRNLGGVLFVSDGNFNQGSNPIYAAKKLSMSPIYSLGVGDTIYKRDHFIKNIAANDVAFINNEFPLVVAIEGTKMGKTTAKVVVELNGQPIASQTVEYKDGVSDYEQVSFLLPAKSVGYQQYNVRLERKSNEFNYENNSRSFYIEVIDSRSKILLLSDAPHPDLSALKSVWDTDENLEIEFQLISEWDKNLKNVDLIVWHESGRAIAADKRDAIINNSISKLFIVGPNSEKSFTTSLGIGLNVPSSNQTDDIEGSLNVGFQQFEVNEELAKAFKYFPPLKSKFGQMSTSRGVEILSYQRIGPIVKKEPQLFFGKVNQFKYGVIYGEGVWRWKLAEYVKTESSTQFNELISKIGQYLVVKQNTSPLRISLPKKFLKEESIIVNATFLNESLDPITSPVIQFELKNEQGKVSKLQFGTFGTSYKLDIGQLPPGKYEWAAATKFAGKSYSKNGVFIVEDQNREQLDTRANHTLLNQLSKNSGGKFYPLNEFKKSIDDLLSREDLTSIRYQESSFNDLIEYVWLLVLLIVLLSLEWFLRRWLGSY